MLDVMRGRFGGSWDGEPPEIHGLLEMAGKKLKVEVMLVEATGNWQVSVFDDGQCVSIESGKQPVEVTARALSSCF